MLNSGASAVPMIMSVPRAFMKSSSPDRLNIDSVLPTPSDVNTEFSVPSSDLR